MRSSWSQVSFGVSKLFSLGIPSLATSLALTIGCGLTINPGTVAASSQNSEVPPGPSGQVSPLPTDFLDLTGCSNPNTGTPSGDWGTGPDPVFVNPWNVIVGTPIYKFNSVFWTSRENSPGHSILLSGAFTDAPKTVKIAPIPAGTADWQSVVKKSTITVPTIQQVTTGLSFTIPQTFPNSIYGFEIEDPTAPPVFGLANVPALNWAIGIPSVKDPANALLHQVYDCGGEPGGVLRVFGKNFTAADKIILQSSDNVAFSLTLISLDSNSIAASIPKSIRPGTYNLWVGTLPWTPVSSSAAKITLHSASKRKRIKVSCSLIGDGVTDNTKRLQRCLDLYAPVGPAVTYISVPSGRFILTGGITGRPYEVLSGESATSTSFVGKPRGTAPPAWLTVPQHFGISGVSMTAPANPSVLVSSGTEFGNPLTSGHLYFSDVMFASTPGSFNSSEVMFQIAGPDIQVYDSSFTGNANQNFDALFADGAIISGDKFILNNWTGLEINDSQNVIFEKNKMTSAQPLGQGLNGLSGGSGLSISRGNAAFGPSALSRDIYLGYNDMSNMGSNAQQVVLNDGDGGSYYGPILASAADTVTLAYDPWWAWMGTSNPGAASMSIVAGTGVGQYAFLKSYSGRDIVLEKPWKVPPDDTSIVAITQYEHNMIWAHNTMTNTLGFSFILADSLESVIEDNTLTNSGAGILVSAFGPYGGPASYGPVINTDILRNKIEVGAGTDIWSAPDTNVAGIGMQDFPGCLMSGLMVRNNDVPAINTIFSTNGVNGVSAAIVEHNQADTNFMLPVPGFLIQDNSPPRR